MSLYNIIKQNHHNIISNNIYNIYTIHPIIKFKINKPIINTSNTINLTPFIKSNQTLIIQN